MSDEIYTKDEHYQDWKSENIDSLQSEWLEENVVKKLHKENDFSSLKWVKKAIKETHRRLGNGEYFDSDDFEAYCRQQFRDRD